MRRSKQRKQDAVSSDDERVREARLEQMISKEDYLSCVNCALKIHDINGDTGNFTNCGATVKLSICPQSVTTKLILQNSKGETRKVTAFQNALTAMLQCSKIQDALTVNTILSCKTLTYCINQNSVITSVEGKTWRDHDTTFN